MKKTIMFLFVAGLLSSCTISRSIQLTGKPIGTKTGEAKLIITGDNSLSTAAKNGNVSEIGVSEVVTKTFIIPFFITKVYGE